MKKQIKGKKPVVIDDPLDKSDENRDWLRKVGKSMRKRPKRKKEEKPPWKRPGFLEKMIKKEGQK